MRYFMQIYVMAGDLMLIASVSYILWHIPLSPWAWIIVYINYRVWEKQGGPMAWNPGEIRKFMMSAREFGL